MDILSRLVRALPPWFSGTLTTALLTGITAALNPVLTLIQYVRLQTRISTATDVFLDIISLTYFGLNLPRRTAEMDDSFRARILANLILERATVRGMSEVLTTLTGRAPDIFEPGNAVQAFVLGHSGLGTGRLGSYSINNQALIVAHRPLGGGGANVAGLGSTYAGLGSPYMAMADSSMLYGSIRDADIYAAVNATRPAGSTMWVSVQS